MSSDKDRDIDNVQDFVSHLGQTGFSGLLTVAFREGSPYSISRKEELDPDSLHRFLHRPILVRKQKVEKEPAADPAPDTVLDGILSVENT